jgi:hypothetical protein
VTSHDLPGSRAGPTSLRHGPATEAALQRAGGEQSHVPRGPSTVGGLQDMFRFLVHSTWSKCTPCTSLLAPLGPGHPPLPLPTIPHAQGPSTRPPLLFVHGSYHAAWCWQVGAGGRCNCSATALVPCLCAQILCFVAQEPLQSSPRLPTCTGHECVSNACRLS